MRIHKPDRISLLQRPLQIRGERYLAIGLTAFTPFDAPEEPLPEVSMWQQLPTQLGKDAILDECLPKPRSEVLVFGRAFATGGKPAATFLARLQLGSVNKTLQVFGPRHWTLTGATSAEPVTDVGLGWENAFGGPGHASNPGGKGLAPIEENGQKVHWLPQVESPTHLIQSRLDRPEPVGFGPMDIGRPERRALLGTYGQAWLEKEFPGYPADLDPEAFMTAPKDQRLPDYLAGGEPFVVENLHTSEARLTGAVTQLVGRCFIVRRSTKDAAPIVEEVPTRLETLVLFPNIRRSVAIFRAVCKVAEDDAHDIEHLMVAFDHRLRLRPKAHYEQVLTNRRKEKRGILYTMRQRDLLPVRDPNAPPYQKPEDDEYSDMDLLMKRERLMERRMRVRAVRELDQVRQQLISQNIDPDAHGVPRELPPAKEMPGDDDLVEYVDAIDAEAERLKAEAEVEREEALAKARAQLKEQGIDLDAAIEKGNAEAGGPPKYRAADHLAQLRETVQLGRNAGAPFDDFERQIEDPAFFAQLKQSEEAQLTVYRLSAHDGPPAAIPAEDQRRDLRDRVVEALRDGASMSRWDLTGADLTGLDLSGRDLREALLERADFQNADCRGADLSGAVLARANLEGVNVSNAKLAGANLGEANAKGALFEGADLTKAILERTNLMESRLAGADLRGANLHEAKLKGADLQRARLDELTFYQCDLTNTAFSRANLTKASFIECCLDGVSFDSATMEAASLIESRGAKVTLRRANAKGLRVALECELDGADFTEADVTGACLRGTRLRGATFEKVNGDGLDLSEALATNARFTRARLRGARFVRADLTQTDFARADLIDALLQRANVRSASFEGANVFRANLMGAEGDDKTSFSGAHVVRTLFMRNPS